MAEQVKIETMMPTDWDQVRAIFIEGIEGGNATFRTTPPTWEQWDAGHLEECRFVARVDGEIVGWIALSPFSNNIFHKGVTEDSIYISKRAQGLGVGTKLLKKCIEESEKCGIWTIQSQIFSENASSIHLHRKFGFKEVGVRVRFGQLNGVWRDVTLLDRRSTIVGQE
ncbi:MULTISPECIES: GNAT family N-acetyltransferase [unclassified Viridibacillus]|uniref:GNAT family N-acetyltransferase n=1 Tax=unclassified Viridibacillus TaxID=2617942 RepID=UPI00096DDD7A|nr:MULTISPECIES: GNAT family N-acetyltransferase [unclassified Viridibacillus]OMC82059.1 N-acetyltransferase [Viridibacillus sp. FSL H8-0123]OMC86217.1 N-acetyltransferase [Viridibacillus sp. FSL H7-0596]